jgi:hypothetical protein
VVKDLVKIEMDRRDAARLSGMLSELARREAVDMEYQAFLVRCEEALWNSARLDRTEADRRTPAQYRQHRD